MNGNAFGGSTASRLRSRPASRSVMLWSTARGDAGILRSVVGALAELTPLLLVATAALLGGDAIPRAVIMVAGVLAMWIVTIREPKFALAVVFAAAPWLQDVMGGFINVAVVDLIIAGVAPIFLFRWLISGPKFVAGPMIWATALYVLVCALVTVVTPYSDVSIRNFVQMLLYVIGYQGIFGYCVKRPEDLSLAPWAYLFSVLIIAAAVLVTGQMFVLDMHKNGIGSVLGIGVVIATHLLLRSRETGRGTIPAAVLLSLLGAALILSASRGGWIGAACGVATVLAVQRKPKLALRVLSILAVVIAVGWYLMPEERRDYATDFDQKNWNIEARYRSADYAWKIFKGSPLVGNGLHMRDAYDATNVLLLSLAESGVVGLLALCGMWVTFGACAWSMSRVIPRSSPYFNLLAIGAGVMVARVGHGMFDHYWARGLAVPSAGAGMLVMCWAAVVTGRVTGTAPVAGPQHMRSPRRMASRPIRTGRSSVT